ncbi:MAG: hypothetical protein ACKO23_10485, partial [Gemmataceae bacterium]
DGIMAFFDEPTQASTANIASAAGQQDFHTLPLKSTWDVQSFYPGKSVCLATLVINKNYG